MKKLITLVVTIVLIASIGVVLTGCNRGPLSTLSTEFRRLAETIEALDDVAAEDINANTLEPTLTLDSGLNLSGGMYNMDLPLNIEGPGQGQGRGNAEKVMDILELREQIRERNQNIHALKIELRADVKGIRDLIREIERENLNLTEEEIALLKDYVTEVREIREILKGTIGKAYRRMNNLRGKYRLENVDLIESEYEGVNSVLALREEKLLRVQEILEDIESMLLERQVDGEQEEE